MASPESSTPTTTTTTTTTSSAADGFGHDEPQLDEESPGWENEDGSSGGRNHFLIRSDDQGRGGGGMQFFRGRAAPQISNVDGLHPFVQTLGLRDLESCLALEDACFEEPERESRETVSPSCPNRNQSFLCHLLFPVKSLRGV